MQSMHVEFDPKKAQSNLKKYGVAFSAAFSCLLDPLALVMEDPDAAGEQRWLLIGKSDSGLLVVCYTLHGEETIRLISARKTTTKEKKYYAQGI
jgi:uncharacterized DUF497 family protein